MTTSTNVIIRQSTHQDMDTIRAFIEPFIDQKILLPRTLDELEGLVDSLYVAEVDGEIVGCAALEIYSRKLAEVRSLAVSDEYRGLGIGKRLVTACVERAREENIFEVMAVTSSDHFFIACGFDFTLPGEKKALFIQTRDEH